MSIPKAKIKTLHRKHRPAAALGPLYWEFSDRRSGFFRLPTIIECEKNDAAFKKIKPDGDETDKQVGERWKAHSLSFSTSKQFRTTRAKAERADGAMTHIPTQRDGKPCVHGLYEGPTGEFTSFLRIMGLGVNMYRGASR
jgi:hypothetical protein